MLIPLILAGMLAIVGFQVGRNRKKPIVTTGANNPSHYWNPAGFWERRRAIPPRPPQPTRPQHSAMMVLNQVLMSGQVPTPQLLQAAWGEAAAVGDAMSMAAIEQMALNQPFVGSTEAPAESGEAGAEPEPEAGDAESWGEMVNAEVKTEIQPEPIDGVEPTKWQKFVSALRTKKPDYRSDNYLGCFEHNRRRLRQLGIAEDTLGDEVAQYKAFQADIQRYRSDSQKLIDAYAGKEVALNGSKHTVTPSGVLGLLKAAGPRGAEGWLKNPEDRTAFPGTTDVFMRCNGCF